MAQLSHPVEPFGEVNVHRRPDGALDIVATILHEPDIEGACAGLALDASASMKKVYGAHAPVSPLFRSAAAPNSVEPVARTMAAYLARFAASGRVHLIYWACSPTVADRADRQPDAAGSNAIDRRAPPPAVGPRPLLPPSTRDDVFHSACGPSPSS